MAGQQLIIITLHYVINQWIKLAKVNLYRRLVNYIGTAAYLYFLLLLCCCVRYCKTKV